MKNNYNFHEGITLFFYKFHQITKIQIIHQPEIIGKFLHVILIYYDFQTDITHYGGRRYEGDIGGASSLQTFLKPFRVLVPNRDTKGFVKNEDAASHFSSLASKMDQLHLSV